eukprot:Sro302_g112290.2  (721) ;mRNA; f:64419-66581
MVAASFGVSQFDVSTIVHAVTVFEESDESKEPDDEQEEEEENMHDSMYEDPYVVSQRMSDMKEELSEAACDGFVEETAPGHYRFAHDRIRESAYSLLPSGDSRKQVHLRVGRQLRGWMDTSSELGLTQGFSKESLLLHAAKQSNLGADLIDDEWELLDLAELNYQAAELAARKAAFYSAMEYLQVGFSHLGDAKKAWSNHYDLALKFNVALARMQYCCGLLDESWETSEMVLQHGKSFRDKSGMYFCRLLSLTQQERADDALSLVLDVLQMTGKPFPRRYLILHCIRAYFKTARFMKETPVDYFVNLPISNDEDFRIYAAFLVKLLEISYYAGYLTYFFLVTCRGLESLAEGKDHSVSSFDIMGWAMVEMSMGDIKAASRHCKLIEAQVAKHRQASPLNAVRGDVGLCSFLRVWTQPIRIDLTLLEESFRSIWVCGAVDIALLESPPLFAQLFASGVPLPKVAGYCDKYAEVAVDYKQMMYWYMNAPVYQAVLNLQGNSENPSVLKGNHIAETKESFLETCTKTANKPAIFQFQIWSACIAYHFRDYQRAKRCIKSMGSDLFEDGPIVWVQYRVFYTGLVYFALFKETRKSKYRRRALAAHRKLKDWVAQGVVNCEYMCLLLESEDLSSGRSTQLARTTAAYEDAIRVVSEAGLCHHHALAQELAGDFLYLQDKGSSPAKQYLSAAVKLYEEWGAAAKVSDIKKRYTNVDLSGTQGNAVP